jgi:hypothetical protein
MLLFVNSLTMILASSRSISLGSVSTGEFLIKRPTGGAPSERRVGADREDAEVRRASRV